MDLKKRIAQLSARIAAMQIPIYAGNASFFLLLSVFPIVSLLLSLLPLNVQNVELRSGAFQSKSGSAQRNTSVQHFGRTRTRRQAAEGNPKTMGFWRRSFPHFFRC